MHPASSHLSSYCYVIVSLLDDLTNQGFVGMLVVGNLSRDCINLSDNQVDEEESMITTMNN
jgi:hypothetical protein